MRIIYFYFVLLLLSTMVNAQRIPNTEQNIPLPSPAQLRWQQYEQIMFIHFGPAAWQGREYDNWSSSPQQMTLEALDTDQWCEVARSWGARMILFVAKHAGGFCWWQTETSDYGVKNIPWKNGEGDVLRDLAQSCKKYGLDLGIYVYPGDEKWGAGIGSGGITADPSLQEAYNKTYRQQLTEVLTKYGPIREVWFDGNCHIEVKDILEKYASDAVILQGKSANIRWVGNEDGIASDPNWYTLKSEDLKTGVATALHSDPDGDAYAPVEVDVPFLKNRGHKWFWAPNTDHLLLSIDQLMDLYYRSVGRGSVLLLNSTPDTTGVIPASHAALYKSFGEEITKRFGKPIKSTSGKKDCLQIRFKELQPVNHVIIQEELTKGQRVLEYVIEGSTDNKNWKTLHKGTSVGNKKINHFPEATVKSVRVTFNKYKATPAITNFAVYHIPLAETSGSITEKELPITIGSWEGTTFNENEWKELVLDITPYVNQIGQYDISFNTLAYDYASKTPAGLELKDWSLEMYGKDMPQALERIGNSNTFRITRSQQTLDDFNTTFRVWVKRKPAKSSGEITLKRIIY